MVTRRARSDKDKLARRADILDAARAVFDHTEVDEFTMEAVACHLGLVKGTLYRYFPTREALLLALASDEYTSWFERIDARLAPGTVVSDPDARVDSLTEIFVGELLVSTRFMRLAAIVPAVLERNIPFDTARAFKLGIVEMSVSCAELIAKWLDVSAPVGRRLLIQLQAISVGLYNFANPAPIIAEVLADPTFPSHGIDFLDELRHATRALAHDASIS